MVSCGTIGKADTSDRWLTVTSQFASVGQTIVCYIGGPPNELCSASKIKRQSNPSASSPNCWREIRQVLFFMDLRLFYLFMKNICLEDRLGIKMQ